MQYSIDDLKNEFLGWQSRMFDDLENVLTRMDGSSYERPEIDPDSLTLFAREIPRYLRLTQEGRWSNDLLIDSEVEGIEIVAMSHRHESAEPYFKHLYRCTMARIKLLESAENLTVPELALLAGVDERTVRNAAATGKKQLTTIKVGSSTMIRPQDASVWLSGRRGFKPTVIEDVFSNAPKATVHSEIYSIVENRQLELHAVLTECGFSTDRVSTLVTSDCLDKDLNAMEMASLASTLGLDSMHFYLIVLQNMSRSQIEYNTEEEQS